jgi:hypothetical protein
VRPAGRACGGKGEMGAFGAVCNAAGLDDMPEQAEIGEVEAYRHSLRLSRRQITPSID